MHPKVALLVKVELDKTITAKFIKPINYLEWISKMVPITSDGIRKYIDFRDLNKVFPKDDFPLPNIYIVVDLIGGHEILSCMDRFS